MLLLAGQIGAGKTAAAVGLAARGGFTVASVRSALGAALHVESTDRHAMQLVGAKLDEDTNGFWLAEYLSSLEKANANVIVDSVRTARQANAVRATFSDTFLVYLEASARTRELRYQRSHDEMKARMSFEEATNHPTEQHAFELKELADLVIDTEEIDSNAVAGRLFEAVSAS